MDQGRVPEACPKYAQSYRLDPQLGALLHLADCYEKNHELTNAWTSFRDAEELATKRGDDRAAKAAERAKALEPRLSRVTLNVAAATRVPGLEVLLNGATLSPDLWDSATPVNPGTLRVEARAPGYQTWTSSVQLAEGARQTVDVPGLKPTTETSATPAPAPRPGPSEPATQDAGTTSDSASSKQSTFRTIGWVTAGIGVVGLGVSTVFLVQRNGAIDDRDQVCPGYSRCTEDQVRQIKSLTDDAKSADMLGKVTFIAGGVLTAGGVALVLLAPSLASDSPGQVRIGGGWVTPVVEPEGFSLSVGRRF